VATPEGILMDDIAKMQKILQSHVDVLEKQAKELNKLPDQLSENENKIKARSLAAHVSNEISYFQMELARLKPKK
jgi:hypothetical protein